MAAHGTISSYSNDKCRCRPCKDANRDYQRVRSARVKAGIPLVRPVPHRVSIARLTTAQRLEVIALVESMKAGTHDGRRRTGSTGSGRHPDDRPGAGPSGAGPDRMVGET